MFNNKKNENKIVPINRHQQLQNVEDFLELYKNFSTQTRKAIFEKMLKECTKTELSILSQILSPLLTVDFFTDLPVEIVRKILSYLDATSLCHCAQVSKRWKELSDDDLVWKDMCERHIGGKCQRCGWGLPLMYNTKRKATTDALVYQNNKRVKKSPTTEQVNNTSNANNKNGNNKYQQSRSTKQENTIHYQRRWKEIYAERLLVERNWRSGHYSTKIFEGHTDSVMCLQIDEARSLMLTGSYDHTIKMWNTDTCECIRTLEGHSRCVRALQFDENKIISGSMDKTIRIWSLKTGHCIRVMESCHFDGIVTLHFDNRILASGSADHTIKVWNFGSGRGFTLTGHKDWVNKVQIFNKDHLFSCSDDHTIKYWDLTTRQCIRTFEGHSAPVQSLQASITYHQPRISKFDTDKFNSQSLSPDFLPNYKSSSNSSMALSSKMKGNRMMNRMRKNYGGEDGGEDYNGNGNSNTNDNRYQASSSSSVNQNNYYHHRRRQSSNYENYLSNSSQSNNILQKSLA